MCRSSFGYGSISMGEEPPPSSPSSSPEGPDGGKISLSRRAFVLLILLYACLSISLTLVFKKVLTIIRYPLFLMASVLGLEAVLMRVGLAATLCVRSLRSVDDDPADAAMPAEEAVSSRLLLTGIGTCVAGEIGLSNLGLMRLSVASHTMIKASTPLFVLCASLVLGLEKPSVGIVAIVVLISAGTALCSIGRLHLTSSASLSISSHSPIVHSGQSTAVQTARDWKLLVGIALTVTAGMAGGLRWGLTQLLTQHRATRPHLLLVETLPVAAASLVLLSAALEGRDLAGAHDTDVYDLMVYASVIAVIGLVLLWTEVMLVATTSSLTLAILATAKELSLVLISVVWLRNDVSLLGIIGFFVTCVGIFAYNLHKRETKRSAEASYIQLSNTDRGVRDVASTAPAAEDVGLLEEHDHAETGNPSERMVGEISCTAHD